MLGMRLEGDPHEGAAFVAWLASMGIEVAAGTVKHRAEGFAHGYSTIRMPWYTPAPPAPIRVQATVGQALAPVERRPARRRRSR